LASRAIGNQVLILILSELMLASGALHYASTVCCMLTVKINMHPQRQQACSCT
jgi:hypothetical protein